MAMLQETNIFSKALGLKNIYLFPVTRPSLEMVPTLANLFIFILQKSPVKHRVLQFLTIQIRACEGLGWLSGGRGGGKGVVEMFFFI